MVALKGGAVARFVAKPDPKLPLILLYGPDRGQVQERASALAKTLSGDDPIGRVDLDGATLEDDPQRLAEEADSVPMFGGSKVVVVRMDDPKPLASTITALVTTPGAAPIVLAAGDLKPTHPVRSRIEKAETAVALPCYADAPDDLRSVLSATAQRYAVTLEPGAADAAIGLLGADHALSVAEIDKLCLASLHTGAISVALVEDMLTDSAQMGLFDVADRAFAGDRDGALRAVQKTQAEGMESSVVAQTLQRQAAVLERLRHRVDAGASPEQAVQGARPPIFYKRRPLVTRALTRWSADALRTAIQELDEELPQLRLAQALKAVRLERIVLRIAMRRPVRAPR